jgi:hypothetical protein
MTFLKMVKRGRKVWFVLFLEHHRSEGMNQEREEETKNQKQFEIKPKPRCNLIKANGD